MGRLNTPTRGLRSRPGKSDWPQSPDTDYRTPPGNPGLSSWRSSLCRWSGRRWCSRRGWWWGWWGGWGRPGGGSADRRWWSGWENWNSSSRERQGRVLIKVIPPYVNTTTQHHQPISKIWDPSSLYDSYLSIWQKVKLNIEDVCVTWLPETEPDLENLYVTWLTSDLVMGVRTTGHYTLHWDVRSHLADLVTDHLN